MGEAKRRKNLGLSPRNQKILKNNSFSDKIFSNFPIIKTQLSKYPYLPVATMAWGLIFLLVDWTKFSPIN